MSRKDFETIAAAVKAAHLDDAARLSVVAELGCRLAETNPRFNYDRFKAACGVVS